MWDVITYACPGYRSLYANAIHVGDTKHTTIGLLYAHNAETRCILITIMS